jgi:hypothetical protein
MALLNVSLAKKPSMIYAKFLLVPIIIGVDKFGGQQAT